MQEWAKRTQEFLTFNDYPVLLGPGTVSHEAMTQHVSAIYETFDIQRRSEGEHAAEIEAAKEFEALRAEADSLKDERDHE